MQFCQMVLTLIEVVITAIIDVMLGESATYAGRSILH